MTQNINIFNYAQTFFIDPGVVLNASEISITSVDLYFRAKPKEVNNTSGIVGPGVTVFLSDINENGFPSLTPLKHYAKARCEFNEIQPSNDASSVTKFTFEYPVNVKTGKMYSIIIKFDANESFDLWTSIEGDPLISDNTINAGPAGQYIGNFYEYGYINQSYENVGSSVSDTNNIASNYNDLSVFKPINDTDLKFNVYCARYNYDSYANTSSNTSTGQVITNVVGKRSFLLPKKNYEFLAYNRLDSTNIDNLKGGERIYQNNVIQSDTVVVSNGSTTITGSNVNFTDVFSSNTENDQYILVISGSNKNLRRILNIQSNTLLTVEEPITFSNSTAQFSKVVTAEIDFANQTRAYRKIEDILLLDKSNANSSLRFVNKVIENIEVANGGSNYSNSDYITVNVGGANGSAPASNATANIITDGSGTITSVSLNNKGYGFVETPDFIVSNSTGGSSSGSDANLIFTVGCTLHTEYSNATLSNCEIINLPLNVVQVFGLDVENPSGTNFYMKTHHLYYSIGDGVIDVAIQAPGTGYSNLTNVSFSGGEGTGAEGYIRTDSNGKIVDVIVSNNGSGFTSAPTVTVGGGTGANLVPVIGVSREVATQYSNAYAQNINLLDRYNIEYANTPIILSRSNEVTQSNVSITLETGTTVNTNISSLIELVITSNNVYTTADIDSGELDVIFSKYSINNDYTNEHLGTGSALAKHISTKINFANNVYAEDLRVYFDAYRPVGTDIKAYAKIHNGQDPEPFDDKNWTLLEYKDSTNTKFSTLGNHSDMKEYIAGFNLYPNSEYTCNGSVSTTLSSSVITGSNTLFDSEISADDMVKIWSPLFPNNYVISIVNSVSSNTSLTLKDSISNNNVVGSGFNIDKIEFKNQAFNNFLNDNVVRYYDSSNREYDNFNTVAVKLVLLSNNDSVVPKVDNIKVIGVSA